MKIPGARRFRKLVSRLRGNGDGTFVQGLTGGFGRSTQRALLYYKTDPFLYPDALADYEHTNLWEIVEIVRILNTFGFVVDVIDRNADNFLPENKYDLFLGLGAGRSGKYFAKYAGVLPRAIKVLLAAGPEPTLSNRLVQEHYDRFNARHGTNVPAMRLTEGIDFPAFVELTDYFLCIGEDDQFCPSTYKHLGRPVLTFLPAVSPRVRFSGDMARTRSRKKFLCFAGDGFICKGVDQLVEAFTEMPDLDLHLCGPDSEPGFFDVLGAQIRQSQNIWYEGFVKVGSATFEKLLQECSFVLFASSSEGCATSVATVMKGGMVPILSKEVGIHIGEFGFRLEGERDKLTGTIQAVCRRASLISNAEYRNRVYDTLKDSLKYTQASFTQTFSRAILQIVADQHKHREPRFSEASHSPQR